MREFVHEGSPARVLFGLGARRLIGAELDRLGAHRVLVVHGRHEQVVVDEAEAVLGDRVVGRFSGIAMHVPAETAAAALDAARGCGADGVLAVGGGSSIGAAKAVALETGLPILAVPTTYAGSEMTPIWGLTRDSVKVTGRDPRVQPRTVVYDPELTVSLPADVSAASGMNAMAHLVEALYSPALSPVTALAAQEGVTALARSLPAVVSDGDDLDARGEALYGAWLAGWALGVTTMGVHHKICHLLGGTWDLPHAPTHAAVLPHATAFNAEAAPDAMARLERALAEAGLPPGAAAGGLWDLARTIGAPTSLAALGWPADAVDEAARLVVEARPTNPRPVDGPGIRTLLARALAGHRPD